jgi:hypothetical protein
MLGELRAGDRVVIRTAHSMYEFWIEFSERAIGVLQGGRLAGPTRVRLTAESATSSDASVRPIRVGERARVSVLGPTGEPTRCFVTSRIVSLELDPSRRAVA